MNDFEKTMLAKSGDPDGELRRYSSSDLIGAYSQRLSVAAALRAHELGVEPNQLVTIAADLKTFAGREAVKNIMALAKGAIETISVQGIDPNEVSISDQESGDIWTGLVPRDALEAVAATLEKAEHLGRRDGALVLAIGKDGWQYSQEK